MNEVVSHFFLSLWSPLFFVSIDSFST
jgi:hypothetical protein